MLQDRSRYLGLFWKRKHHLVAECTRLFDRYWAVLEGKAPCLTDIWQFWKGKPQSFSQSKIVFQENKVHIFPRNNVMAFHQKCLSKAVLMCNPNIRFKVYRYNFRGSNSAIFIFVSLFSSGQPLKERICSSRSKFLSLRIDPFLQRLCSPESKHKVMKFQKLFLFVKLVGKNLEVKQTIIIISVQSCP